MGRSRVLEWVGRWMYLQAKIGDRELKPDFGRLILTAGNQDRERLNHTLMLQHARLRHSRVLLSPAVDAIGGSAVPQGFQNELRLDAEGNTGSRAESSRQESHSES